MAVELRPGSARRALVIGGSMAGLLAARVLAEHFEHVVVIERDRFPKDPEPRKGLPQARHVHVLLARGSQTLNRLFPRLDCDLAAQGAVQINWTNDCWVRSFDHWWPRVPSDLVSYACSRDLLEHQVRSYLRCMPRIRFLEGYDVQGLLGNTSSVTGVQLHARSGATAGNLPALDADLVVDASGRGSHAAGWLETLGYPAPAETIVNSFLGYASRFYQKPPGFASEWRVLLIRSTPPGRRGGVILPIEDDRWLVTLAGAERDYPPTEEAGFNAFIDSLQSSEFSEAIAAAEPCSPISGYQRTANSLRHYERLTRWPKGFIALGDAVCAFNPVYGQGMTAAAVGAEVLDYSLRTQPNRFEQHFQKQLAQANQEAWLMATGEDYRFPSTEGGKRTQMTRFAHWYLDRLHARVGPYPDIYRVLMEVTHLLKPTAALFHPSIAMRVLAPQR